MSIGEALAEARRQAGLTVAQVSDQTRIREMIIAGIERDDFSACSDDVYVWEYIRSIARAVGADPEPLIQEYETAQLGPQATTDDVSESATFTKMGKWLYWASFALATAGLCIVAFPLVTGSRHAVTAAPPAPTPASKTTIPGTVAARTLTPASATAFGPNGAGQGDNGGLAHLAIDANPATAWHTDWYTSARLGNLYGGTGLLVDMGRPVTITAAQITLGRAHGAGFQLCVGAAPALADLPPLAHAANAGGVVRLRLTTPAHGRYVLIWFTSLPRNAVGTFQASVYNLRLEGWP